jgi:hypothetical protein
MIAIKLHKNNPQGIPSEWPKEVRRNQESLPQGFDLLMTEQEYDTYLEEKRPLYDAYLAIEEKRAESEQIKQEFESTRKEAIQLKLETQVLTEAQESTDIAEILENKPLYKFWQDYPDQFPFPANYKVNHLVEKEIKTYRIIQPHNKQVDRQPNKVPALWTEITLSNGIEIWNRPTGGDGKYPYKDPSTGQPYKVLYDGETWENNHQGSLNVWQPGVFGWKKI